jgi:hypothetical protein
MARTGTHTLADLQAATDTTITRYGIEDVLDVIQTEIEAHNRQVTEMVADFATPTTEREEPVGGVTTFDMEEADENNRPRTQKPGTPDKVGYPLRRFTVGIGWTAEFFAQATPARMAELLLEAQGAHLKAHIAQIRKALLSPTNYSFYPYIADLRDTQVDVKALYNGDGMVPPVGPNLEQFAGTHNHYLASATLTTLAVSGLIATVTEHSTNARVMVFINKADAAAWSALSTFRPYLDVRERARLDRDVATGSNLDTGITDNRAIGIIDGAEVWTKPWMPQNYSVAVNANAPQRALRMREAQNAARRGLRTVGQVANFPLQAEIMEALFGYGVHNRGASAALQFNNATYNEPAGL